MKKYCFIVDVNALDVNLLLLANWDAWWWPWCLLRLLLYASGSTCFSNVHVLLQLGRVLFLVCSHYGPIYFFFGDTFCLKIVLISFVFRVLSFPLFLCPLEVITGFVIQLGAFGATKCLPCGFPVLKINALVLRILKQFTTILNICSLTSSLAPGLAFPHVQHVCPRVS